MMFVKKIAILVAMALTSLSCLRHSPQFGGNHTGSRLEKIKLSKNYADGRFKNQFKTPVIGSVTNHFKAIIDFITTKGERIPDDPVPIIPLKSKEDYAFDNGRTQVVWLGHSSVLIRMDHLTILTDPVLSERASPFSLAGPKSFYDPSRVSPERLEKIDVMLISHDHYDHLDYQAIQAIDRKTAHYVVPLGVGSHLEAWGVNPEKIHECDWHESFSLESVTFTATPTRHFSGRGPFDRFKTLWASYVIKSSCHTLFFGGDSGYDDGFKAIGEAYGPFDLTMLECGAYSQYWPSIHMLPEETARAHQDLKGRVLMPIHWARFNLSLHSWTEPVERLLKEAGDKGIDVITPMIGEGFDPGAQRPAKKWWRK